MLEYFGDRDISLVKEITKLHESAERTTLSDAVTKFEATPPKGEYVLIVEGAKPEEAAPLSIEDAVEYARNLMSGGMPASMAAKNSAKETGFKKSDIYAELVK